MDRHTLRLAFETGFIKTTQYKCLLNYL